MVNMCKCKQLQKHDIATTNLTYVSILQTSRLVLDNHVLLSHCFMYLIVFVREGSVYVFVLVCITLCPF